MPITGFPLAPIELLGSVRLCRIVEPLTAMFELKVYVTQFTVLRDTSHSLNALIEKGESYPQALEFIIFLNGEEMYRHVNGGNHGMD